jgi:hypothetical protein
MFVVSLAYCNCQVVGSIIEPFDDLLNSQLTVPSLVFLVKVGSHVPNSEVFDQGFHDLT